jgi:hypothetical protein
MLPHNSSNTIIYLFSLLIILKWRNFIFYFFLLVSVILKLFISSNKKVIISVEFQYFLIKEDLKLLHDSYDIRYQSIIVNNAKDALKVKKYFGA